MSFLITFCLIIDNAIIPLLSRASLEEFGVQPFFVFRGRNTDFGAEWYPDFGEQMVVNLVILASRPMLHVLYELFVNRLTRCGRRYILYRKHDNNLIDNIKYIELNAGPEYIFEIKSAIMNAIIVISLLFGSAFPILYAICFCALLLKYALERYSLASVYRLPPKFSG